MRPRSSTYRIVRKGGDFQRLLRNLRFVAALRHENCIKHLRLDFVVQWRNFRDIPGFVAIGRALGVDAVSFRAIDNSRTFTQEQLLKELIANPNHPDFGAFLEVLRSPTLDWKGIDWGNIWQFRNRAIQEASRDEVLDTIRQVTIERDAVHAEMQALRSSRDEASNAIRQVTIERDAAHAEVDALRSSRDEALDAISPVTIERDAAKAEAHDLRSSRSWRMTAPLRRLGMFARRKSPQTYGVFAVDDYADDCQYQSQTIPNRDEVLDALRQITIECDAAQAEVHALRSRRDETLDALRQVTIERNTAHAAVHASRSSHDEALDSLRQVAIERDAAHAEVHALRSSRDEALDALRQVTIERDAAHAEVHALCSSHDEALDALRQVTIERDAAHVEVHAVRSSRCWRMTAPIRSLSMFARRIFEPRLRSGIFSQLIMAALVLPATFYHYKNLTDWARALKRGSSFFSAVLNSPDVSLIVLITKPKLLRAFVLSCVSLAQHIRRNGGVLPAVRNLHGVWMPDRILNPNVPMPQGPANPRKILVADYRIPRPDVSAGERATVGILRDLRELGYQVVFLPNNFEPSPKYEAELTGLGVQVITRTQEYHSSIQYLNLHGYEFGAFYLFRVDVAENMLSVIRDVVPTARVIFHAPDLYFLREARKAELEQSDRANAQLTHQRELAIMRRVDHVVVVSPVELSMLRAELPKTTSISLFPAVYAPVELRPAPCSARSNVFFLGGFGHPPNVSAVEWFVEKIWPLVRRQLPEVEFHIVGSEIPPSVLKLGHAPGVKVVGFVPDLQSLMSTMRVGVAPLLYGAGIKGKLAMTLGAGIPCVCTDIATEGMGIQDDVHARVESEPHRFAEAIVSLYTDAALWARLSKNGQSLVQDKFSDAPNRAALLNVLNHARALPLSLFCDYCTAAKLVAPPVPDAETDVDVSIIVPVYNKWHLTRTCLTSVVQTSVGSGVCYELILADDCSTDETMNAAEAFPGLRVVKAPQNAGFLRNCNNAASHARGRHIVLLNNDTIVLPGWLAALYQTIEADPSIAIVGSKLLYPDGHIQEAGAGLLANGDGVSIGRFDEECDLKDFAGRALLNVSKDEPVFNVERETDYISGASILIRRAFWQSVGGFDERYKNAYCEDFDLAMMARFRGMRVVYQPASEVVHFEHQSYADLMSTADIDLQNRNKQVFLAKWGDRLRKDHLPPEVLGPNQSLVSRAWQLVAAHGERTAPPAAVSRRKSGRLNILYFTPFPSHPSNHGNQVTIQQFARRFQSFGHTVHFALLQGNLYTRQDAQAMFDAWDTFDILPNSHPLGADGSAIPFDGWYENSLGKNIRVLCARYDIDIVFCHYVFQSKLLEFVPSYVLKVIDTHDKMADRYEMLRSNGQPLEFFSCTSQEEGAYLRRADIVIARRDEEAHYFELCNRAQHGRCDALLRGSALPLQGF